MADWQLADVEARDALGTQVLAACPASARRLCTLFVAATLSRACAHPCAVCGPSPQEDEKIEVYSLSIDCSIVRSVYTSVVRSLGSVKSGC